jgi:IS5 family transposase
MDGDELTARRDRGYADKPREPERVRDEDEAGPRWFMPFKRAKGCDTTPAQKRLSRLMAALRSAFEHPFRVLKRQFGYTKMRYRGLFKNEQLLFSQFALGNLYIARRVITPAG